MNDCAVDIVSYVNGLVSRRLAKAVEQGINGDGIKEFTGITNDADVQVVVVEEGVVTIDTLINLYTSLHPAFLVGAILYITNKPSMY